MAIPSLSPDSQNGSSDPFDSGSEDWGSLPDPDTVTGTVLPPDTKPEDLPICPVCGDPIIRDPSWKRMRKYHPECAKNAKAEPASGGRIPRGSSKAIREAELVAADYRSALSKMVVLIGLIDKYDAFVIGANLDTHVDAFRAFLVTHDRFRQECLNVKGGGSVFGLVASAAFIIAPILAHHGLIPGGRFVLNTLQELPFILYELSKKLKEGEEGMSSFVSDYMEAAKKRKEEAANAAPNPDRKNAPYTPGMATVGPS